MRLLKLASCGALAALIATQVLAQSATTASKVTIADFKFGPDSVTAAPNTPVTWTNNDGVPHQVVIAAKNLKTAVLSKGQSAQLSIAEPGSYDYVCGIHGSMKGKIVVK